MATLPRPQQPTPAAIMQAIALAFDMIERGFNVPRYVTATKPTAATAGAGVIIFVSDGGVGNVFQGSNGTAWIGLG